MLIIVGNIDSVDGIFRKPTWIVTDWKGLSYKYNIVTVYLWNLVSCLDSDAYLLLTEFEVHTGSYGPSFSPLIYGPSAKRAGHKLKGKKRGSVTYGTDRENEVSKIFIISLLCVTGSGTISIQAKRHQISEAPRKQNKSIWNRLIHNLE